jgi:hypothetical protein
MTPILIGRAQEQEILKAALASEEAEMVAVIGRRRVGKTFLVKTAYGSRMAFEITGLQNAPAKQQLEHFHYALVRNGDSDIPVEKPDNWMDAFRNLTRVLERQLQGSKQEKLAVFFDELPWLAADDSGFLSGLEYFWNSWAVNQRLVVVVCGSAASWMIKHVVNNTGGLYNRITRRIYMQAFSLKETKAYFEHRGIQFSDYEIVQLYMAMGGIPHYLKEVRGARSATQNIDEICFSPQGLLRDEFRLMFLSLFDHAEKHIAIVRALFTSKQGLPRQEIIRLAKIAENGHTSSALEELEQSGFITAYHPFGKVKKNTLYRLSDEYSLFYLQFIENRVHAGAGTWLHLSQTQEYKTWSGYAFENICLKHLAAIKHALGISGIYALSASFYQKPDEKRQGAQIDLVLDRADHVINIFEIKFYNNEWSVSKETAEALRRKMQAFAEATKTRKRLSLAMISPFGLRHNAHSLGLVEASLTLEDLFVSAW